jgi:hypothetical protein
MQEQETDAWHTKELNDTTKLLDSQKSGDEFGLVGRGQDRTEQNRTYEVEDLQEGTDVCLIHGVDVLLDPAAQHQVQL